MIPTSVRYRLECEMSLQNDLQISYLSQLFHTSKGGGYPLRYYPITITTTNIIIV